MMVPGHRLQGAGDPSDPPQAAGGEPDAETIALVDTHCHLDLPEFDEDRDQVVAAAREAGVIAMITVGIDLASSRRAVALAQRYPGVYAAVGIHPLSAEEAANRQVLAELQQLAAHPRVVAIGETGLDYYRSRATERMQRRALQAMLELAAAMDLPVILHNRDATGDLWDELVRPEAPRVRGVLHCFSADADWAVRFVQQGFYIGLDGPVTFKNGERAREVARAVPGHRLLVETDAPYLAPHPHRGRRNQPAWVRLVAERIAAERGCSLAQLAAETTANAVRLFRLHI